MSHMDGSPFLADFSLSVDDTKFVRLITSDAGFSATLVIETANGLGCSAELSPWHRRLLANAILNGLSTI